MALIDSDLNEIKNLINERGEIEQKARDEALNSVRAFLSDPNRTLTSAEEQAIKQATKKFNWGIILITAATAISVGFISNQYVQAVEERGKEAIRNYETNISEYEKKFNSLLVTFNEKVNSSIDKTISEKENSLTNYVFRNEKRIDDFSDQFVRESKELYKNQGLLQSVLNESTEKMNELKKLSFELSVLQNSMIAQKEQLTSVNKEILNNEKVLEILRNPKDHFIVNNNGNSCTLLLGNGFIQWGSGKTSSSGSTTIKFAREIRGSSASVNVVGEDPSYNSFGILKSVSDTGAEFVLINPKGTNGWTQLRTTYRYFVIGELK